MRRNNEVDSRPEGDESSQRGIQAMKTFVEHVRVCMMFWVWFSLLIIIGIPFPAQSQDETTGTGGRVIGGSAADLLRAAEEKDAEWRRWMDVDENGVRSYWFRRSIIVEDPPAGGTLWITADDNYSFYLNGRYIASDETGEIDWQTVNEHDIGEYLVLGENIIAVQVDDVDDTRNGLLFAMVYRTIPDIQTQLDRMVENELATQAARREEKQAKQRAAQSLRESQREPPSIEQLREMRAIEKNKLD